MKARFSAKTFAIMLALSCGAGAAGASQAADDCDALAASPFDASRPPGVPGVAFKDIDAPRATQACMDAFAQMPFDPRVQFQLARARQAGKADQSAMAGYKQALSQGFYLAASNIGVMYEAGYDGARPSQSDALAWYVFAAQKGVATAKKNAAFLLDSGQGLQAADHEKAAVYWRELADAGDAEAAEKVGMAIHNGQVRPLGPDEMLQRLRAAANNGRQLAAFQYTVELKAGAPSREQVREGARYALMAYRLTNAAAADSDEGWPVYRWSSFRMYDDFVQAGAPNVMSDAEYRQARLDYQAGAKKYSMDIDCGGTPAKFDIYLWQWNRNYPSADPQGEWLRKARGCTFSDESLAAFRRLYELARADNASYPDFVARAIERSEQSAQNSSTQLPADSQRAPARQSSPATLTDNQAAALAGVVVVAGVACAIWPDQCKQLAWEAAKGAANKAGGNLVQHK